MTQDDIIRLTKEAGWVKPNHVCNPWSVSTEELERFAALVAAAEREACAKVAEEATGAWTEYEFNSGCMYCAKAIRARGET